MKQQRIVTLTDPALVKSDFMHENTACRTCHTPTGSGSSMAPYGPMGTVERILGTTISIEQILLFYFHIISVFIQLAGTVGNDTVNLTNINRSLFNLQLRSSTIK